MAASRVPLPHFLNLPLPPIPSRPAPLRSAPPPGPLVFKLTLSADQFDELSSMDADVEEGEEGGLRLEFDPAPALGARLHLTPARSLQLAQPKSGLVKTNKPEEVYHHLPASNNPSRSSLAGLFRVPIGTPLFALQPHPSPGPSSQTPHQNGLQSSLALRHPALSHRHHGALPGPALASQPSLPQRDREKASGQKLKERRLEEERKRTENTVVPLAEQPPPPTTTKKGRTSKPRLVRNKSVGGAPAKSNGVVLNSSKPPTPAPAAPPKPAPRRALPGSQSGKQLASEHNQLSNSPISLCKPMAKGNLPSSQVAAVASPPVSEPLSPVSLTAPTFKKSSSSKRGRVPPSRRPPIDAPPAPNSVPLPPLPHAHRLSTSSAALTSLSEESEPDPRPAGGLPPSSQPAPLLRRGGSTGAKKKTSLSHQTALAPYGSSDQPAPPVLQPPEPPVLDIRPNLPSSSKSSHGSHSALPAHEPCDDVNVSRRLPATSRQSSGHSRTKGAAPSESPVPGSPTLVATNGRTKRLASEREGSESVGKRTKLETGPVSHAPAHEPAPLSTKTRANVTIKKVPVLPPPPPSEGRPINLPLPPPQLPEKVTLHKRSLEGVEGSTNGGASTIPGRMTYHSNKRSRPDECKPPPSLPTIRKVNRDSQTNEDGPTVTTATSTPPVTIMQSDGGSAPAMVAKNSGHDARAHSTAVKPPGRVKKKKKPKQPIDYTSSEPEEGEKEEVKVGASGPGAGVQPDPQDVQGSGAPVGYEDEVEEGEALDEDAPGEEETGEDGGVEQEEEGLVVVEDGLGEGATLSEQARSEYERERMIYHEVYCHYQFVCQRLERIKRAEEERVHQEQRRPPKNHTVKKAQPQVSVEEVDELLNECFGLENELEILRASVLDAALRVQKNQPAPRPPLHTVSSSSSASYRRQRQEPDHSSHRHHSTTNAPAAAPSSHRHPQYHHHHCKPQTAVRHQHQHHRQYS